MALLRGTVVAQKGLVPPPSPRRLGEILVQDYHVLDGDVREALEAQKQGQPDRLGQFLVRRGILTDRDLATALGQQLRIPVMIGLPRLSVADDVIKLVPVACAEKKLVIPVAVTGTGPDRRLVLAMADPTDQSVISALEGFTGIPVQPAIATEEDIRRAFKVFYLGEVGHADPAELTDSFEVMRTRLRTNGSSLSSSLELFAVGTRAPAKSPHSGEIFKPLPFPLELGENDPIPMPEESFEFESTQASASVSVSEPFVGVLPRDPAHASSTVGA